MSYRSDALARWAERIAARWTPGQDVYAYFNNDAGGAAVRDAVRFAERMRRAGGTTTRVPPRSAPAEPEV